MENSKNWENLAEKIRSIHTKQKETTEKSSVFINRAFYCWSFQKRFRVKICYGNLGLNKVK